MTFLVYRTGQPAQKPANSDHIIIQEGDGINDSKDFFMNDGTMKRDVKSPFITAVEDEDTPEDLQKFGVKTSNENLLI